MGQLIFKDRQLVLITWKKSLTVFLFPECFGTPRPVKASCQQNLHRFLIHQRVIHFVNNMCLPIWVSAKYRQATTCHYSCGQVRGRTHQMMVSKIRLASSAKIKNSCFTAILTYLVQLNCK